jgi:hypothetical protein
MQMLLLAPPETNQDKESCTAYFVVVSLLCCLASSYLLPLTVLFFLFGLLYTTMNNLNNKNNNQAICTKPKILYVKRLIEDDDKHHQVSIFRVYHFQSHIALTTLFYLMWASCKSDRNVIRHEVAEVRKLQVSEGLRNLVSNLFPNECPSKVAAHVLLAESMIQDDRTYWVFIQDYLPILRRIGLLERIAERTETKPEHRTGGRMTRKKPQASSRPMTSLL